MVARLLLLTCLLAALGACGDDSDGALLQATPESGSGAQSAVTAKSTIVETTLAEPTTATTTTTSSATTTTTTKAPTTTTGPPPEPSVVDSGFSYTSDGDLSYAVILENPSDNAALLSLVFDISFIDDEARIAEDTAEFVEFLVPNARTAVGGSLFNPPENIVALEIEGRWQAVIVGDAEAGTWNVSELEYTEGFFDEVTGFVSHTFGDDMDVVQMTAVFYDDSGAIVGGDWGLVDVPAGREVAFDITVLDPPAFDNFEVYVAP